MERFTDGARPSFLFAQDEARLLGHNFIGTKHLLLGLLHDNDGATGRALRELGILLEDVRHEVKEASAPVGFRLTDSLAFTPRAKRFLQLAR